MGRRVPLARIAPGIDTRNAAPYDLHSLARRPAASEKKRCEVKRNEALPFRRQDDLVLICGSCEKSGRYPIGTVFVDPSGIDEGPFEDAVSFTGYFRCASCDAPGPWKFPVESKLQLMSLLSHPRLGEMDCPIQLGRLHLFDKTPIRYVTDGEEYLKRLIAAEPASAYLWNRLGNLYLGGGRKDLARPAFEKSLELDGSHLESLHSLGQMLFEEGEWPRSAPLLQKVVKVAWKHKDLEREMLRGMVRTAFQSLIMMNDKTNGATGILSAEADELGGSREPVSLVLKDFHLSSDSDWDELVSLLLRENWGGFAAGTTPRWRRRSSFTPPVPAGPARNGPCPCLSGSKYKNCCGR